MRGTARRALSGWARCLLHHLACDCCLLPCYTPNPCSVACASSRGLAALLCCNQASSSCRLPQLVFVRKVLDRAKVLFRGTIGVLYTSTPVPFQGSEKLPGHDLRGSTPLELSTASTGDLTNVVNLFCRQLQESAIVRLPAAHFNAKTLESSTSLPSSPADTLLSR